MVLISTFYSTMIAWTFIIMHDPTLHFTNFKIYINCLCIILITLRLCELILLIEIALNFFKKLGFLKNPPIEQSLEAVLSSKLWPRSWLGSKARTRDTMPFWQHCNHQCGSHLKSTQNIVTHQFLVMSSHLWWPAVIADEDLIEIL